MNLSQVIQDSAAIVAVVGAVLAMITWLVRWIRHPNRRARALMRSFERRYAQVADRWDRYDKRFLENTKRLPKQLSLTELYVRLSFKPQQGEAGDEPDAFQELARYSKTNICVLGEPGSGKSTFLKAYAVRAMRHGWSEWNLPQSRIPFLITLREFAATLNPNTLPDYEQPDLLVTYLLRSLTREGFSDAEAKLFLGTALAHGRVDVLLDGLDEVAADRMVPLRRVVRAFYQDHTVGMNTALARLVITCRTDNFRVFGSDWQDELDLRVSELDGLRDEEMKIYVHRLEEVFDEPDGPARYLDAVWSSGTLSLHRVPLVLAMSVAVFANKSELQIPDAVSDLYDQMIGHLLERHVFPNQGVTPLKFLNSRDKRRFLQRFAALNALAAGPDEGYGTSFADFPKLAMVDLARGMAGELDDMRADQAEAFVDEIIGHAGLLSPSGTNTYQFSHRSIQEYLVAAKLSQEASEGWKLLLSLATNPTWNFVIQLYTAMVPNQADVNEFLTEMLAVDAPLAGVCLAWGRPDDATATLVLATLQRQLEHELTAPIAPGESSDRFAARQQAITRLVEAILAAVRSPRRSIADDAMHYAEAALHRVIDHDRSADLLGGDTSALLRVVDSLSKSGMAQFIKLLPVILETLPDNAQLVGPLWRCLRAAESNVDLAAADKGIPEPARQGLRHIASRLLTLVRSSGMLATLQNQPRAAHSPFTDKVRLAAYPFQHAWPIDSNLVTLLCWAELLDATPSPLNRYFEARLDRQRPHLFARVESDRVQNQRGVLFWLARLTSALGMAAAIGAVGYLAWQKPSVLAGIATTSLVSWLVLIQVAISLIFVSAVRWSRWWPTDSWATLLLRPGAAPSQSVSGNAVAELFDKLLPAPLAQTVFLLSPSIYAFALAPLHQRTTLGYLALTGAAQLVLVWLPFLALFDRGDLGRTRNPYISMYDDPQSIPWIIPESGPASTLTSNLRESQ